MKMSDSEELHELHDKIKWYDRFVDYIYKFNRNDYNDACKFADGEE